MAVFTRRIMGIETEYGITFVSNGQRLLGPEETARTMFRPVMAQWGSTNIFHPNASRLYLDVGSHPEIATAECDSLSQLLAYDRAGDVIVDKLAQEAEVTLLEEGIEGKVFLFKNNIDSVGNSYGCHENYLISREVVLKSLGKQLVPFLITRQLIAGAGAIKQGKFQLSQRADHVWEGISSATTRSRPIINTRDEPHANSHKYRRMHVIVGDSNMAEPTTALKVGSTLLMLEMIEAGFELPGWTMSQEIEALRAVSQDPTGSTLIELTLPDGEQSTTRSALEIQCTYLDCAKKWLAQRQEEGTGTSNAEMARVVALWEKTLTAIASQDYESLASDIDWAIKLQLLHSYQQRLGLDPEDFSHPKLAQIDLVYHDIRPGRGLARLLESRGRIHTWIDPEQITQAVTAAPQTTRAKLRGEFLERARQTQSHIAVDWLRLKVNRPEPQIVELGEPFDYEDPRVQELLDYMSHHAE